MVVFPNAKINIGLNILRKRKDGYHDIETLFYPIGLKDALEYVENGGNSVHFYGSGLDLGIDPEQNIVLKAYRLLQEEFVLPGLDIHLHKVIPSGAGLGGGSSDAAFLLRSLNEHLELEIPLAQLKLLAGRLGADCPFFLENQAAFATGIGEELEPAGLSLSGNYLLLVKPPFDIQTKTAYAGVKPMDYPFDFQSILKGERQAWQGKINNDFEKNLFPKFPELARLKQQLRELGGWYVSMSGSGSSVYGFFDHKPTYTPEDFLPDSFIWLEELP